MNIQPSATIRPIDALRDAQFAEYIAFVAVQLAGIAINRVEIPALIKEWVAAEARLSAFNAKRRDAAALSDAEEAEQGEIEVWFKAVVDEFLNESMLDRLGIEFSREPGGPAIRILWDDWNEDPATANHDGLVIAP